ncbi:MAG: tRNA pseudouridine(55) synthase TruB, partial [Clostridia bacterium]
MNGIVAINKSSGISSSDVVIRCRNAVSKMAGEKIKCGHFGTLDPAACGVLLVGFGKSTRLFDYFLDKKKKYRAQFVFGKTTDTLDSFGKVVDTDKLPVTKDVVSCLTSFVGDILQVPPKFCANSVDGVRAYDMARQGIDVQLQPKKVKIF